LAFFSHGDDDRRAVMTDQVCEAGQDDSGDFGFLKQQIASSRAVIYCSSLTDVRPITAHLDRLGVPFRLVTMGMGSLRMRERFHALESLTGWHMLPQVFVDGRFVGGYQEILALDLDGPGRIPSPAFWLGAGGLIPFFAGAIGLWAAPFAWREEILNAMLIYGAVILSFIGAVHWGLALHLPCRESESWRRFGLSVTPALIAWAALLTKPVIALSILLLTFSAMYPVEGPVLRGVAPPWYGRLRAWLSAGVVLSLLLALLGLELNMKPEFTAGIPGDDYGQGAHGERGAGPALAEPSRAPHRSIIF